MPTEGWSNWFALEFTARLILDTDSYMETSSVAVDEIYFTNQCGDETPTPASTTALPNTTTPLQPNVRITLMLT